MGYYISWDIRAELYFILMPAKKSVPTINYSLQPGFCDLIGKNRFAERGLMFIAH